MSFRTKRNHCSVSEVVKILFVHQNFPGQYRHVIRRLARYGQHQLLALGLNSLDSGHRLPEKIKYFQYHLERGNTKEIHPFVMETETKIIRAEGCARAAEQLMKRASYLISSVPIPVGVSPFS